MGLFGLGGARESSRRKAIRLCDGSVHTAEEYGYFAVRHGSQSAVDFVDMVLEEQRLYASLEVVQAIRRARFNADICCTMLELGIFTWHARDHLNVGASVGEQMMRGARGCLADVRAPDRSRLQVDHQDHLLHIAAGFEHAIREDIKVGAARLPNAIYVEPLPSTACLLHVLAHSYVREQSEVDRWFGEMLTPAGLLLQHVIEASTVGSAQSLFQIIEPEYLG